MKVVVIGGGPAGMMAAITSSENGNDVTLIEKMESLGRKLLITGKGRCNITSSLEMSEFIGNIPGNGRFLYSAFQNYTNQDILDFLKKQGVGVKEERGNRVFPKSDKSQDVLTAFTKKLNELKVKIKLNTKVTKIEEEDKKIKGIRYVTHNEKEKFLEADKVIIATGGKSYPQTGSTGDGYELVKELGHSIIEIKPSLVPFTANDKKELEYNKKLKQEYENSLNLCKQLQGLSLKNVAITLYDIGNQKKIYEDFGEMIFTHFGVSGPMILSSSAHLLRYKDVENQLKNGKIKLMIDLKPGLTKEKLDLRIQRDFLEEKNKQFRNSLDNLLPKKLIEPVVKISGISENKMVNEITKEEREKLVDILKNFMITIKGFRSIEEAIITSGGIHIKEVNPSTMESKLISGLYFAGEILDVDAYTGGFNLQIAYSTGYTAGIDGKKEEK